MKIAAKFLLLLSLAFIFLAPANSGPSLAQQNASAASGSATAELAFWNQIKDSGDASKFKEYLSKYPNGMFSDIALAKSGSTGAKAANAPSAKSPAENKTVKHTAIKKNPARTVVVRVKKSTHLRAHKTVLRLRHHTVQKVAHMRVRHLAKPKLRRIVKRYPTSSPDLAATGNHGSSGGGGGGGGSSGGGGGWGH